MPLLASFIGGLASFFAGLLAQFMSFRLAIKYASFLAWATVIVGYATAVSVCLATLRGLLLGALGAFGAPSADNWMGFFSMGIGMVVPSAAPAIIACVASVWIATQVFKIQRQGIENFSK